MENVFVIIITVLITLFVSTILIDIYWAWKNARTFKMHRIITNAIYDYKMHYIDSDELSKANLVNYSDMEEYDCTYHRIGDNGYTHILPKEKFELIKEFIKEQK